MASAASTTTPAHAGFISKACLLANREVANNELCTCIDDVAQISLTKAERKKVSGFFGDPHKTQIIRRSDRRGDEIFWERYQAFGERARKSCG